MRDPVLEGRRPGGICPSPEGHRKSRFVQRSGFFVSGQIPPPRYPVTPSNPGRKACPSFSVYDRLRLPGETWRAPMPAVYKLTTILSSTGHLSSGTL